MRNYYTADLHCGHTNIIRYCKRPFASVEEMDQTLIQNINAKVRPEDNLFVLGDFCFKGRNPQFYLNQIRCKKVHLIIGNHDSKKNRDLDAFTSIQHYLEIKENVNGQPKMLVLFHYPIKEWNGWHRASWHLFGHVHNTHPDDIKNYSLDIGVDCHNFQPLNIDEIAALMAKKQWENPYEKWAKEGRLYKNHQLPEEDTPQTLEPT